ncbi:VOC family protein [Gulosibacter macacae]|uniref:VOC family protein n=1 Tax=Gulosibacter macacae TaxID=2488791 RepID=A0A3P3VWC8_9MICO|nr:VOC family protein [Gulosibacter macacae]RRJ85759.1 VOC family protein [Gulosibacter macacae]
MTINLDPYLALNGTAREALEFYQSVLGGDLNVMTYGQSMPDAEHPDLVMHGQLNTAAGNQIMASDAYPGMPHTPGDTVAVSLTGDDPVLADHFAALSDGAEIVVPFAQQMWGDSYGQLRDRFGVIWHVNLAGGAA